MAAYFLSTFYAERPHYGVVEKLLMYGVFGGTPRYHALIDTSRLPAEEIVALLMKPRAIPENEVRFLLGSEQIRGPAPYDAILNAIAGGETKFNGFQQLNWRGALSSPLRTLLKLRWIRCEFPFDESSESRTLYRVADPFLTFLVPLRCAFGPRLTIVQPDFGIRRTAGPAIVPLRPGDIEQHHI